MGETEKCDTYVVSLLIYCMLIITWPFPFVQAQIIKGICSILLLFTNWFVSWFGDVVQPTVTWTWIIKTRNKRNFISFAFDLSERFQRINQFKMRHSRIVLSECVTKITTMNVISFCTSCRFEMWNPCMQHAVAVVAIKRSIL